MVKMLQQGDERPVTSQGEEELLEGRSSATGPPIGLQMSISALVNLTEVLVYRFTRLDELRDLDNAVRCQHLVIRLASWNEGISSFLLCQLGDLYIRRSRHHTGLPDINRAVECYIRAAQLIPDRQLEQLILFNKLGGSYMCRFFLCDELADISKAVECLTQALHLTPDGHDDKPATFNALGRTYMCRFKRLGEIADNNKALECFIQAVQLSPDSHADKSSWLSSLGTCYMRRFEHCDNLADINKALHCHMQAVQLVPNWDDGKPAKLSVLGNSYLRRFERYSEIADINKTIEYYTQAAQITPDGHEEEAARLAQLGDSYLRRFEFRGDLDDVDKALGYNIQAVKLTPDDHFEKPGWLANLGNTYFCRFGRVGGRADINNALDSHNRAVQLTPDGHDRKPAMLTSLGNSYLCRFESYGDLADINKALEYHIQAVQLTPDSHADKPAMLTALGNSCMSQSLRCGELANAERAIECLIQAVRLTPDSHAGKPLVFNNLGISYMRRFQRHDELSDVGNAIECHIQAVHLTPDGHASKPLMFNNLGNAYTSRFECHGELTDINEAIECYTQAVQLAPDSHPSKPNRLHNLGTSYFRRFEHQGEVSDLNQAIKCHTQAMKLTPDGHASKPDQFNALGNSYLRRFMRYGDIADVNEAIKAHTQAKELAPHDHANRPNWFYNLGNSYWCRFMSYGQLSDLQDAVSSFKQAAQSPTGHPRIQFDATREWARVSSLLSISPQPAYQRAIELLPQLVWLGTTVKQRYSLLTEIGGIVTKAASSAISLGEYECALEWLEQGRSVVWNQVLQLRTPFDNLHTASPTLASRLKEVATKLELAGSRPTANSLSTANPDSDLENKAQQHRLLATEWDQLLDQARQIPGFENFMRPHKADALMRMAKDGPIVIINGDSIRCDALIIRPNSNKIDHLPLENFSLDKAVGSHIRLMSLIGHRGGRSRGFKHSMSARNPHELFKQMLGNLWLDIVKPILDFLGYMDKTSIEEMPHVTWCTTGPLSFLPLHAAGCYDGLHPNACDLIVSSYTPTLSALLVPSHPVSNSSPGILAVGQQHTNGHDDLPNTVQELAAIKEHAKTTRYLQLDGNAATVNSVLSAMDEYSWVHLACHATQNKEDPAQSAFHLHDGKLTLSTITQRSYQNKGLAFLSACQTASGDEKLPDESIHLAAGMLMAGYPSVIATLWSIQDEDAPEISRDVYADLLKDGKMDCTGAARALHKAVAGLRAKIGESSFERWVPFVHVGS